MIDRINALRDQISAEVIDDEAHLEAFRLTYLSRKGLVSQLFDAFKALPGAEKAAIGKEVNQVKTLAESIFATRQTELKAASSASRAISDDLSLPVSPTYTGSLHPLSQVMEEMTSIFMRMGFTLSEGPEIEDDFHNFTALNFPSDHPARDMQDTFFIRKGSRPDQDLVLRTHTSPVQIRLMQSQKPPIRAIMPGRVFRNETVTYKSYFQFYQIEGLVVDRHASMAGLIDTLVTFAKMLYGSDVRYRVRSSFFPFTEPSIEMDVWQGAADTGRWLEVLGAGMVDPNVFKAVGIDPEEYTGYAFGLGIDRMTMLKYGIDDIRTLYENDLRMLSQFPG